ncbi:MAG: hypothetical protein ABJF01_17590 [bacterium]
MIIGANGYVAAALLHPAGTPARRDVAREIERQIQRALWRAEQRGRRLPYHIRQGASWVFAQRRIVAHEIIRALRQLGTGRELAKVIAESACHRFPRDGVVIIGDDAGPRLRGEAPRQRKTNPRAQGTSPRQRRAAARLAVTDVGVAIAVVSNSDRTVDHGETVATGASDRPMEELAPGWAAMKAELLEGLTPHERASALLAAQAERERIDRSRKAHPS